MQTPPPVSIQACFVTKNLPTADTMLDPLVKIFWLSIFRRLLKISSGYRTACNKQNSHCALCSFCQVARRCNRPGVARNPNHRVFDLTPPLGGGGEELS